MVTLHDVGKSAALQRSKESIWPHSKESKMSDVTMRTETSGVRPLTKPATGITGCCARAASGHANAAAPPSSVMKSRRFS
jgi:hypothetical protein